MNRRNFLKAFVALPGAAALAPLLPAPDAVAGVGSMWLPPAAPTVVFRTSIGEWSFLTTPAMWRLDGEELLFQGELSFTVEKTCEVYGIDAQLRDGRRIAFPLAGSPYVMSGDHVTLLGGLG